MCGLAATATLVVKKTSAANLWHAIMLKVKESAIKTMAGAALAAANQDADAAQAPVNSTAIVLLNKKLRAGFGFSGSVQAVKPASAPFPIGKSATKPIAPKISAAPIKSTPAQATAIPAATTAKAATSVLPTAPATVKYQDKATLENDINSILGGLGVKATQPVDTGNQERKDRTERLAEEAKRREEDQKKKLEEQRHARAIKDETPQIATTESEATKQKADELQKRPRPQDWLKKKENAKRH